MGKATGMRVTDHAVLRFRERVIGCTEQEAVAAMSTARIRAAIAFGAKMIRLGGGQRLIIRDHAIITVTPATRQSRNWLDRTSRGD